MWKRKKTSTAAAAGVDGKVNEEEAARKNTLNGTIFNCSNIL
jgi:hypothetical protein